MKIRDLIVNESHVPWVSSKRWPMDKTEIRYLISEQISPDLSFGIAKLESGGVHLLHHHRKEAEVYYIIKGRAKVILNTEQVEVCPGTAIYLPPELRHKIVNTGNESLVLAWAYNIPMSYENLVWDE